jgi:hypothetical protein
MRKSKISKVRNTLIITIAIFVGLVFFYNIKTNNGTMQSETQEHQFYKTASDANEILEASFRKGIPLSTKDMHTVQNFLDKYYYNKNVKLPDYPEDKLEIIMYMKEEKLHWDIYFKKPTADEMKKEEIHKIDALVFNTRNSQVIKKYFDNITQK